MAAHSRGRSRRSSKRSYAAYIIITAVVLFAVLIVVLIYTSRIAPVCKLNVKGLSADSPADAQALCRADYAKFKKASEGHEGCVWVWCGKGAVFLTNADDLTIIAGSESGFTHVSFIDEDGTEMTDYVIDPESPPNELGRISLSGDGPFNYEDVGMSIRQALRAGELDYDGALYLWKVGTNTVFAVKPDAYTLIDGTQVSFTDDGSQLCFCRILDTDISE